MDNPSPPPAPTPPNYAAANAAAVQSDISTLAYRKQIEQASKLGTAGTVQRPILDSDGHVEGYAPESYDFTGLGDAQTALAQAKINGQTADLNAQSTLDITKKYGSAFEQQALDALKQADPIAYALRQQLGTSVSNDLALGTQLSPRQQMEVEQQVRGSQAARGNILGNASIAQEAMANAEYGQNLYQQRLGNASQYIAQTPITAQFQNLQGAQQGAAPYQPVQYQPGIGLNANAGAQGAQFASNIYGTQGNIYGAQTRFAADTYTSPWQIALGFTQAIASGVGAAAK